MYVDIDGCVMRTEEYEVPKKAEVAVEELCGRQHEGEGLSKEDLRGSNRRQQKIRNSDH